MGYFTECTIAHLFFINSLLCVMKYISLYVAIAVVLVIIILFAIPAIKMHSMLDCRSFSEPYNAADFGISSRTITLKSADGITLGAYEVEVESPKAVIICLGGIHSGTITDWYGHASLFARHSYASLLLDLRAHGASSGEKIYAGTREWMDVCAAVAFLKSQPRYEAVPVIVMGVSMGAATAITSTGRCKDIDALISLSSYSSWEYNFNRNVEQQVPMWLAKILAPFVNATTSLRFGEYADVTPLAEIQKLGCRPALLVHSVGDEIVPFANFEQLVKAAPNAQKWVVDGDNHCIIEDFVHPEQDSSYCSVIVKFIEDVAAKSNDNR